MSKLQTPNPKPQTLRTAIRRLPSVIGRWSLVIGHWPLAIVSLCLVAIRPWFKLQPVCSDDFGFHLLRLVQLDALLRRGVLYSRWAPSMALGYGYPFFNFYAPLSYYVAEIFSLAGLGLQPALIATFALSTVAAGLSAYALARDHFSPRSSLVAAVAYAYAPYLGYDAFFRGNLAETLAWAVLPLALWAMGRLARRGGLRRVAGAALAYAAVLLTHNVFALVFSPLLAAYGVAIALGEESRGTAIRLQRAGLWSGRSEVAPAPGTGAAKERFDRQTDAGPSEWRHPMARHPARQEPRRESEEAPMSPPSRRRQVTARMLRHRNGGIQWRVIRVVVALLLGLGLSAFFWLPALIERAYVYSDRLLVPPIFVYWNNFINLRELLAAPRAIHPDLLNPSPPRALGLVPVLLGLPGLVGLWRFKNRAQRVQVAFFGVALLTYAWLTTASSRVVWDSVPLLEYVQFPWRLLGPAALCLSVLIAAAAELLPANRNGSLVAAGAIALLVGGSLFWFDPRYCSGLDTPTAASITRFELVTHTIGTTAKGEYLPRTVETFPKEPAETALDPASLPPGTTVATQDTPAIGADLIITASQPFTAVYNGFDYPGWQVTVDGVDVPITPGTPHGRITFPVPAGRHDVSIRFGETAPRGAADGLSLACLALAVGMLLSPTQGRSAESNSPPSQEETPLPPLSGVPLLPPRSFPSLLPPRSDGGGWGGAPWTAYGLLLLILVTLLQHTNTPLYHPGLQDGTLPNLDTVLNIPFEGGLTLLGFNQEQSTLPSGSRLRLDLFWTAREPPPDRYERAIALLGPDGLRWNPKDTLPPRDFREPPETQSWPVGTYVQDSRYVETDPGTPPGTYDLSLTLFERETLAPMRVLEAGGQPGLPALSLGQITVTRPQHSLDPAEVTMQHRLDTDLGPLKLLGLSLDRTEAAPGDPFLITLLWLATERPATDLTVRLTLLTADGAPAATFDLPPTLESHPTTTWQAGDLWRGQHALHLPAALDDGDYTWQLTLLPIDQSFHLPSGIHITAPPHTFTPPLVDVETEARLGELATLVGATIQPQTQNLTPGTPLTVTLVWRAEAETHTSYHVFLHLLAPDDTLVAQSDSIPAQWARPTTGWLSGEYITDVHVLTLPAEASSGPHSLSAGLYDPSGGRLSRADGGESVVLTIITMRRP